ASRRHGTVTAAAETKCFESVSIWRDQSHRSLDLRPIDLTIPFQRQNLVRAHINKRREQFCHPHPILCKGCDQTADGKPGLQAYANVCRWVDRERAMLVVKERTGHPTNCLTPNMRRAQAWCRIAFPSHKLRNRAAHVPVRR